MNEWRVLPCIVLPAGCAAGVRAAETGVELEARVMRIAAELRCPVCPNESVAESQAGLARDLREQVRRLLAEGRSEQEVLAYMSARHGDAVRYRPPWSASTWALWAAPSVLLAGGMACLCVALRRRQRLDAARFEPDPGEGAPR